jgi:hypothetical protein
MCREVTTISSMPDSESSAATAFDPCLRPDIRKPARHRHLTARRVAVDRQHGLKVPSAAVAVEYAE